MRFSDKEKGRKYQAKQTWRNGEEHICSRIFMSFLDSSLSHSWITHEPGFGLGNNGLIVMNTHSNRLSGDGDMIVFHLGSAWAPQWAKDRRESIKVAISDVSKIW